MSEAYRRALAAVRERRTARDLGKLRAELMKVQTEISAIERANPELRDLVAMKPLGRA